MGKVSKKINVLIVDDEVDFLLSISKALQRRNFEVKTARNGYHALKWLQLDHIDVVILDLKMPGIDGEEIFHRIQQNWPKIPVIMLTGHGTIQHAFKTSKEGIFDYIAKPCDADKLSKIIWSAVKRGVHERETKPKLDVDKIKLLIVDDEIELLDLLSNILTRRNMLVSTAKNGDEAQKLVQEQLFDVAIIGLKLQGIDGLELLSQLKKLQPFTEVIILTNHDSSKRAFRGSKEDAFDFLIKPVNIENLIQTIRNAFRKSQIIKNEEREKLIREIKERYID